MISLFSKVLIEPNFRLPSSWDGSDLAQENADRSVNVIAGESICKNSYLELYIFATSPESMLHKLSVYGGAICFCDCHEKLIDLDDSKNLIVTPR